MHSLHKLGIAMAIAGGLTLATAAQAAPIVLSTPAPAVNDMVVQVHRCHDNWRHGRIERRGRDRWDWHRHAGRHCRTVTGRSYDRRHRPRDWHRRGCFDVGPVTICP